MKSSQNLAETIETLAKENGISVSSLLQELEMNKNALFTMKKSGYLPRVESLCKFADYFQCSLDYLVGRTDEPQPVGREFTKTADKETIEIAEMIKNLSLIERSKVILFIDQISKQKEESLQQLDIQISQSPKPFEKIARNGKRTILTDEEVEKLHALDDDEPPNLN